MQYIEFIFEAVKAGIPLLALAAVAYVVYVAVTKGVPAAKDVVVGWWTKSKVVEQRLFALEQQVFGKAPAAPGAASGTTGGVLGVGVLAHHSDHGVTYTSGPAHGTTGPAQ